MKTNEMMLKCVNLGLITRAIREHERAGQAIIKESNLTEREAITLFLANEFPEQIRRKTVARIFGVPASGAENILKQLLKKKCIEKVQHDGCFKLTETRLKLLSDFKSREATCWWNIQQELPPENSKTLEAWRRTLDLFYGAAMNIFERRALGGLRHS